MIHLGIIGTAGRGDDQYILEEHHWQRMADDMYLRVKELSGQEDVHVVSGGAAWADHLAVYAFRIKLVTQLTIVAPCSWDKDKMYYDTQERNWRTNPGGTANHYHKKFSEVCGFSSLWQINQLFEFVVPGKFHYINGGGFIERNSLIAEKCNYLLAYTTGEGDTPKDGGTLDTWKKCSKKVVKMHIPILNLPESPPPWKK